MDGRGHATQSSGDVKIPGGNQKGSFGRKFKRKYLKDLKINEIASQEFDNHQEIESEAIKMAQELQAEYWSVSAQTGENVTRFFRRVTALAFDGAVQRMMEPNNPVVHPSGNSLLSKFSKVRLTLI